MSLKSRLLKNRELKSLANMQDSSDLDFLSYFKEHLDLDKIYAYSYNKIFAEKRGKNLQLPLSFTTEEAYLSEINRIIRTYDGVLSDKKIIFNNKNSIIKILMPPLVNNEPYFSIERKNEIAFSEYFKSKLVSSEISAYFRECLSRKANIFIVGDYAVNKSDVLNFLLNITGDNNKNIIYDTTGKILVQKPCSVSLAEGNLQNAVYTDYDNIFCSNVNQNELSQILKLIISGNNGFVVDLSIKSGVDVFSAIRNLVLLENINLFEENADFLVSSAIDVIVFTTKTANEEVCIIKVSEVSKGNQNNIILKDIFVRNNSGTHISTGNSSKFYNCENLNSFVSEYLEAEHIHNYISGITENKTKSFQDGSLIPKFKNVKEKLKKLKKFHKEQVETNDMPTEETAKSTVEEQQIETSSGEQQSVSNINVPEQIDYSKEEIINQTLFANSSDKIKNIFEDYEEVNEEENIKVNFENTENMLNENSNNEDLEFYKNEDVEAFSNQEFDEDSITEKYTNRLEPKIIEEPRLFSEIEEDDDDDQASNDDFLDIDEEDI